jgi:glutamate 5-kinase
VLARQDIADAHRVVVKIGSSSLTVKGGTIDDARITALVATLADRVRGGRQVLLVSSGAIAAVTGQVLLTADDLMRRGHYRNAQRTLDRLLELGMVPVINENDTVATDEIRFGDNDRLAALVAHVTRANALILLSDVDGLYDGDPRKGGATKITEVRGPADLAGIKAGKTGASGVGRGGMATKVDSALIATQAGVATVLTAAPFAAQALAGEATGTYFAPTGQRPSTRLLWLAHAAVARGTLTLDAGAVTAVVQRRASLLPAGITAVDGTFEAGDPVDLADEDGKVNARGLVNYDAAEIPGLMGRSTRWLASRLGAEYEREVVHRDDLVILLARSGSGGPRRAPGAGISCCWAFRLNYDSWMSSVFQVTCPTMPSTPMWNLAWKARTVEFVTGPNIPSTASE